MVHTMVTGLLETYLDEMMGRWKSVIVVGTGNEGNAAGHVHSTLQEARIQSFHSVWQQERRD